MKSAFIISDVHLRKMASPQAEAMIFLLKKAQKEAELFVVLGDLFDVWVGAGSAFVNEYKPLVEEFRKLTQTCRVLYIEGNHDLQLKGFWQDKLKVQVFERPQLIDFYGLKIWAEHGDEINRQDYGYLFLRWFLRTPLIKLLVKLFPSRLILNIGNRASHASREYTNSLDNRTHSILNSHVAELRSKKIFDVHLSGHTHIATDLMLETPHGNVRVINQGSWFDGPHYLEIRGDHTIQRQEI